MLKNGRRFFLHLCLALLACLGQGLAHAQFDKTPWPRTQATPAIDMVDLHGQHWTSAALKGRVMLNTPVAAIDQTAPAALAAVPL